MTRLYDTVGWLLSSLGLALLVCGWVLVPQNRLLSNDPIADVGIAPAGCAGHKVCNYTCEDRPFPNCTTSNFSCRQGTNNDCLFCVCSADNDNKVCICK
ncbi:MAG: hypothetical protein KatS3mg107_0902 [Gemmataceae bacterium]|nr:MAG: hypothetical protein KatS3mg107_0902 [Gemmataceae bacterium]